MPPEIRHSTCPLDCPSTCALEVEKLDRFTIGRIRGAPANSYTAGTVCAKVARFAELLHHPGRLLEPLQRIGAKGDGAFRPISWAAALDEVGEAFLRAEQRYGAETVWPYYFAGTMGLLMRDGINRLRNAKGYSLFHTTICVNMAWLGFEAGTGKLQGVDPREMAKSDLVVIWGTNAAATQVNVMHHAIQARKDRGAKIVVIDPYLNATARRADMHLCLRPGSDGALACAVMHVLFRDGHADWDYMERHADAPRELEAHLQSRDPEWAAAITGLDVEEIEAFAKMIGVTKRSYFRLGFGFTRSRNGPVNMHAALSIPTVSGAWQYEGGGAFKNNEGIYPWDKTLIEGLDVKDPSVRMLDQSRIGAILTGDRRDLGDGPPVTALLIQNTNPMVVAPDLNQVHAGFARQDLFTCVHEQLMTESAKMADIVLPATAFLEHGDIYQGGGHPHIQLAPKIVEPPGEARDNHFVICEIARRVGAQHRGFEMSGDEILAATLGASGFPDPASLEEMRWLDCRPAFEEAHYLNGFAHGDGKFHFRPDWHNFAAAAWTTAGCSHGRADATGMPEFPDHWAVIEETSAELPFRLVTAPARNFLNTTFTETLASRQREGRPSVRIHPSDAAELGIQDGQRVRLANRRGELTLIGELFSGLQPGVLVVEGIWPNGAFEGGIGINALTGADAVRPIGGAAFHDNAVSLAPAGGK